MRNVYILILLGLSLFLSNANANERGIGRLTCGQFIQLIARADSQELKNRRYYELFQWTYGYWTRRNAELPQRKANDPTEGEYKKDLNSEIMTTYEVAENVNNTCATDKNVKMPSIS